MKSSFFLFALTLVAMPLLHAETWTSRDGKTTYEEVKVLKIEADAVTILDSDGGARVPLASLPNNLQKRFHYNRVKAAAAAACFTATDQESKQEVLREQGLAYQKEVESHTLEPNPFASSAPSVRQTSPPAAEVPPTAQTLPPEDGAAAAPGPDVAAAINARIDDLHIQIASLTQDASERDQEEQTEYNEEVHYNQNGAVEHDHTLGHSQQAEDDRRQIATLENQIAALQRQLTNPPPAVSASP
jgi:hypothetical protein